MAGPAVRYWKNLGGGRFDVPREMKDAPSGFTLEDPAVQLIDADGDGRIDLMIGSQLSAGYFPPRFSRLGDRRSFPPYPAAPTLDPHNPQRRLLHLHRDRAPDPP